MSDTFLDILDEVIDKHMKQLGLLYVSREIYKYRKNPEEYMKKNVKESED